MHKSLATFSRFLVGGAINTGSTFLLYWALLLALDYQAAYAISFASGIVVSYLINTKFVFRATSSWRKIVLFPLIYLLSYLAGAWALTISISHLNVPPAAAPFISVCITIPMTYLLSRMILSDAKSGSVDS